MSWTFDEIRIEWFGAATDLSGWDVADVERAFARAASVAGDEWVIGREFDVEAMPFPGIGRRGGWGEFMRVYWLGKRVQSIEGAAGEGELLGRLAEGDAAANSELTAIHLLRHRQPMTELEIGPNVRVGARNKRPDFRIRQPGEPWTFVEVTQPQRSSASARVEALLRRIVTALAAVPTSFVLEIVLWREPTVAEESVILAGAIAACRSSGNSRSDVADCASLLVKDGNTTKVIPSILPADDGSRMAQTIVVGGIDELPRQVLARVPFADTRAKPVLAEEARQLPKGESGLVMVDAHVQVTVFSAWPPLLENRFRSRQHTRVAGVILFFFGDQPTSGGMRRIPYLKLVQNPHGEWPLAAWIPSTVDDIRTEARSLAAL